MPEYKTRRIRDPVHGLITFSNEGVDASNDQLAWRLLNTPEMQRLRRIRQLGVSEFTFPGATHTRFSHSVGVFHLARELIKTLDRFLPPAQRNTDRAKVALFAALLHDVGHGPFSHAFERVQDLRKATKHHEDWTADIIESSLGQVSSLLNSNRPGLAADVARLLRAKNPEDAYHAAVSSSFDADRLDYLRRDRLMTGSGAGAIDFDWLMDNLRIGPVYLGSDDDESDDLVWTFCLDRKALPAAESFLLARFNLFEQVYLHKATRGFETLVMWFLSFVAEISVSGENIAYGIDANDPLVRFFGGGGGGVSAYLRLDDAAVWSAASRVHQYGSGRPKKLAGRLLNRERLHCFDLESQFPRLEGEKLSDSEARRRQIAKRIDDALASESGYAKDVVSFSAYGQIGADDARAHKRLTVLVDGRPREITALSEVVLALRQRELIRYYFESRKTFRKVAEGDFK